MQACATTSSATHFGQEHPTNCAEYRKIYNHSLTFLRFKENSLEKNRAPDTLVGLAKILGTMPASTHTDVCTAFLLSHTSQMPGSHLQTRSWSTSFQHPLPHSIPARAKIWTNFTLWPPAIESYLPLIPLQIIITDTSINT